MGDESLTARDEPPALPRLLEMLASAGAALAVYIVIRWIDNTIRYAYHRGTLAGIRRGEDAYERGSEESRP